MRMGEGLRPKESIEGEDKPNEVIVRLALLLVGNVLTIYQSKCPRAMTHLWKFQSLAGIWPEKQHLKIILHIFN